MDFPIPIQCKSVCCLLIIQRLTRFALKAVEKDRARRYGSSSDFAADIARYLKYEPVLAVPPSMAYGARFGQPCKGRIHDGVVRIIAPRDSEQDIGIDPMRRGRHQS